MIIDPPGVGQGERDLNIVDSPPPEDEIIPRYKGVYDRMG